MKGFRRYSYGQRASLSEAWASVVESKSNVAATESVKSKGNPTFSRGMERGQRGKYGVDHEMLSRMYLQLGLSIGEI